MGGCTSAPDEEYFAKDDKEITREENRVEGVVKYKVNDRRFIEMPKWPVILLDTTGSMTTLCAQNDSKTRKQLVYETLWQIVQLLTPWSANTDGNDEYNYNDKKLLLSKGVPLITFNAIDGGIDRGLYHPNNFVNEWNNLKWHGGTHIMDGWRKMLRCYEDRFSDRPQDQWPLLLALIITDGELQDGKEFEQHLKNVKGRIFVEIAVVGFGEDHDRALKHYNKIAKSHDHVRVTAFSDHIDPVTICKQLISLIDPKCIQQISLDKLAPPSFMQPNQNDGMCNYNSSLMMTNQFNAPNAPFNPNY